MLIRSDTTQRDQSQKPPKPPGRGEGATAAAARALSSLRDLHPLGAAVPVVVTRVDGSGAGRHAADLALLAAIVKATTFFNDANAVADASRGLGEAMVGINVSDLPAPHRLSERGW